MKFSTLLPPANEVWGKVMFSQVFVHREVGGGWLSSMHHRSHDQVEAGLHPGGGVGGLHTGEDGPHPGERGSASRGLHPGRGR